ncbi:protein amnionless [Rana temporaria]|uniref:protein amnionless n=1 Tax=Rana temporaria TaxID=8407 RepID=UPI001AACEE39|nr:protein amnionless [Rana temporaria]
MNAIQILLLVLLLSGGADAVYKRWIPNTNFENASNWAEQRLPCSQDTAVFASNKKVSVFVQSAHSLRSLYLPLDGEFLLSPGAGFMAAPAEDPTCGEGSLVNFGDVDHYQWFDPTLWQSAVSVDALENGNTLFHVDSERVPCQHDDVIFSSDTSFRVQVQQTASEIQLKSASVLGRKFSSGAEFGEYLASHTGRLQFPGPARPQVTNTKCVDRTGCLCGNEGVQQEICSALLQHLENKCPEASCANPLKPIGHCCGICGAIISLEYTSEFDLETYRSRLIHSFLSLAKYSEVKLAISKVQPLASAMGGKSLSSEPRIQVVCIDEKTGSNAGMDALQLANDIMEDIQSHGQSFGITTAEMDFSTGASTSTQKGPLSALGITGIVLGGVVLFVSLLGLAYYLYRTDAFRLADSRFFWLRRNISRLEEDVSVEDGGFSNPVFDPTAENEAKPRLQSEFKEDSSQSAIQFSNPLYDGNIEV